MCTRHNPRVPSLKISLSSITFTLSQILLYLARCSESHSFQYPHTRWRTLWRLLLLRNRLLLPRNRPLGSYASWTQDHSCGDILEALQGRKFWSRIHRLHVVLLAFRPRELSRSHAVSSWLSCRAYIARSKLFDGISQSDILSPQNV